MLCFVMRRRPPHACLRGLNVVILLPMIKPLPNPDYFPELKRRIERARRRVVVVNFVAELEPKGRKRGDDPVLDIARALIAAKRRGVDVVVFLEGSKLQVNYPFYRMLKAADVDIWMDTSQTFIHHKVAVIDDRWIFVGSHNLTRPALVEGEEFSVVAADRRTIARFHREVKRIARQKEVVRGAVCRKGVPLPANFLGDVTAPLYRAHADNAFDLYMRILYEDGGRPGWLPIREKAWCTALGIVPPEGNRISDKYRRHYYQQRMNRLIGPLRKRGLIEVDRKGDAVRRVAPSRRKSELEMPASFWDHGWPARLSFSAKYFYLISLTESIDSPFTPWWKLSINEISAKYGCHRGIGAGARELADFNLLERLVSSPVRFGGVYSEEATFYRTNPFYDMANFERKLDRLARKFPKGAVDASRRIAGSFWKSHDLETIEGIASLMKRYGRRRVLTKSRAIARLPKESSRRCLEYLVQIVSG